MIKEYYSYEDFRRDLRTLTKKINKPFDTIMGISRGGLSMAQMLGEYYNIRKVYAINSIGYDDTIKLDEVRIFNTPDLSDSKAVLIVDDILDSGETMVKVLDILKEKYPDVILYVASIFYKKSAKIAPDWFVKEPQ
ncbi:MAG: phosphoribosyltransferase family protein, partial [Sulfurovaceae bacterium]|nr:phosphoribosyltransferase family protein [Sulfurovaceae bacterium]